MFWCVYDNKADDVVGFWTDICAAEEFLDENQAEDDIWYIFPYDEWVISNVVRWKPLPVNTGLSF